VVEICQNRTADKGRSCRGPSVVQIEKCKTNESLNITWAYAQEISDQKDILRIFMNFYVQHKNLFQDSNFPKSYLPQIRGILWDNNEIKMIRSGHYSSNNFQESNKIKSTKKKTLSYLPRVLFFNAFELGAESANQVISNKALRSIAEVFSTIN
jgi:hypothetical protein